MSEYNVVFDVVLYYTRKEIVKPEEPVFNNIKRENTDSTMDNLLDIYSALIKKYKKDIIEYEKMKNDSTVKDFIIFSEDDFLIENIIKFEKNEFFVDWNENSKRIINEVNEVAKC